MNKTLVTKRTVRLYMVKDIQSMWASNVFASPPNKKGPIKEICPQMFTLCVWPIIIIFPNPNIIKVNIHK